LSTNPVPKAHNWSNKMDIKALYQTQERVQFQHFRDGEFWYKTQSGFAFPVPLADLGNATLNAEDKATLFVR